MRRSLLFLLLLMLASTPNTFAQSGFSSISVSSGWNLAVGLTFNKAGSAMFVWEKGGKVWVVENSQKKLLIDISPDVGHYSVMG